MAYIIEKSYTSKGVILFRPQLLQYWKSCMYIYSYHFVSYANKKNQFIENRLSSVCFYI